MREAGSESYLKLGLHGVFENINCTYQEMEPVFIVRGAETPNAHGPPRAVPLPSPRSGSLRPAVVRPDPSEKPQQALQESGVGGTADAGAWPSLSLD